MGDVEQLIIAGLIVVVVGAEITLQFCDEEKILRKAGVFLGVGILWIWALFSIC